MSGIKRSPTRPQGRLHRLRTHFLEHMRQTMNKLSYSNYEGAELSRPYGVEPFRGPL